MLRWEVGGDWGEMGRGRGAVFGVARWLVLGWSGGWIFGKLGSWEIENWECLRVRGELSLLKTGYRAHTDTDTDNDTG